MPERSSSPASTPHETAAAALPVPARLVTGLLEGAGKTIGVEMNFSGQFQKLLRENTGIALGHRIGKWNGRPMTVDEVVEAALKIHREGTEIVELTHGV